MVTVIITMGNMVEIDCVSNIFTVALEFNILAKSYS